MSVMCCGSGNFSMSPRLEQPGRGRQYGCSLRIVLCHLSGVCVQMFHFLSELGKVESKHQK
jgi:hypothetical protein